jgi:hypothetical protein
MSIRNHAIRAAFALAVVASLAGVASAEEREQNVYADAIAAQQPTVTILDALSGGSGQRQEASNAAAVPVASDLPAGSGPSIPGAADHMYDYLSGPTYQGGT